MAYPSEHYGLCSNGAVRVVLLLVAMFLVGYIIRTHRYSKGNSNAHASCPCVCDCFEDFTLPLDYINSSYADCGKHDPYISEEMEKNMVALMSEEMNLQIRVANDSLEHTKALAVDALTASSHYQKEAEKCTAQTETCEEARQRAEAGLVEERRLSALWEMRAREFGWVDSKSIHT